MESINISIINLLKRDLARARKMCYVLHHDAASTKLYIYWLIHFELIFLIKPFFYKTKIKISWDRKALIK